MLRTKLRRETTARAHHRQGIYQHGQQRWESPLWGFPLCNSYSLHRPDLLHNIQLGLIKYLIDWIQQFLGRHQRLSSFDKAWASTTNYPGFLRPRKLYRQISQWSGKELLNLSKLILPCLAAALVDPKGKDQREEFPKALTCTRNLVWFVACSYYKSHDEKTLHYMDTYLKAFHDEKEIFRKYRVTKTTKRAVEAELDVIKSSDNDNFNLWVQEVRPTRAQREARLASMKEEWSRQRDELHQERGEFNFVKMHLLLHFTESIRRYGPLPYHNTEHFESQHRSLVKDGYNKSNKNDSFHDQIFNTYNHRHVIDMRESKFLHLVKEGYPNPDVLETIDAIPRLSRRNLSKANRRAQLLGEPPRLQPNCMELRAVVAETNSTTRTKKWSANSVKEATLVANHSLPEGLSHLSSLAPLISRFYHDTFDVRNMTELDAKKFKLVIYRTLHIPVLDLQHWGAPVYQVQKIRSTGNDLWWKKEPRNDHVLFQQPGSVVDNDLIGLTVAQVLGIYKVIDPSPRPKYLALLLVYETLDGGYANPHSRLCRVRFPARREVRLLPFSSIKTAVHLVPFRYDEKGRGSGYFVNNMIDRKIFLNIY